MENSYWTFTDQEVELIENALEKAIQQLLNDKDIIKAARDMILIDKDETNEYRVACNKDIKDIESKVLHMNEMLDTIRRNKNNG